MNLLYDGLNMKKKTLKVIEDPVVMDMLASSLPRALQTSKAKKHTKKKALLAYMLTKNSYKINENETD